MGVSGSGKTETSLAVAQTLGYRHIEADHFHPEENVQRMRAGTPLSDADRIEWLQRLTVEMRRAVEDGVGFVLACSALKRSYRNLLREAVPNLCFAHLEVDYDTAVERVGGRAGHFMPISLVDSQFATLESPAGEQRVLIIDASQPRERVLTEIVAWVECTPGEGIETRVDLSAQPVDSANTSPRHAPPLTREPIYTGMLAQGFDRLTDWLMAALMAFMVIVVFSSVVLRYAFGTGWTGAEELSRLAFVWLVFVGVASSMRRGELMSFGMLRDRFPNALRRLVDSISWLLVAGASLLAAMGGWNQMQFGWTINSPVVGYPLALATLPILASMLALAILALVQLVNVWRRVDTPPAATANVTAD
ncbi:gluconokinase, GntK/IdnK-type [Stutzerimonas azotifigens]|uniref:Multifunctional fusion protein n=1 Tax=Stutzerimonas azotifigens TaxID=291995 RepID=A0ABR5Z1Q4_9GAMM|nr:gluconokinase, GntK/IdnK-type [Stutzerimonas azotifigens]MBA1274121.1 TRAP transporter small permease subunit [Stutzerimonas azotifigens]